MPATFYQAIQAESRYYKLHRLQENIQALDIELPADDLKAIGAAADTVQIQGDRYMQHLQQLVGK